MRHQSRRTRALAGRWASATVALVVCTVATATALVAGRWSAIVLLIAVAAALGSYWWMVTAEARHPALRLRTVVFAILPRAFSYSDSFTATPRAFRADGATTSSSGRPTVGCMSLLWHSAQWRAKEMGWNYVTPDPEAMRRLAAAFRKVDRHLDALRDWGRREAGAEAEPAALAAAGRAARSYERAKHC